MVRLFLKDFSPSEFLLSLKNDRVRAVWHLDHLQNPSDCSNFVQVVRPGNFCVIFFLADNTNQGFRLVGLSDQPHASVSAHTDGDDNSGKQDGVSQRQEWKNFGDLFGLHGILVLFREDWNEILILHVTQSHHLLHLILPRSNRMPNAH